MLWSSHGCNDGRYSYFIDISQEIFAIDLLTAVKHSVEHRRKHVMTIWRPAASDILSY